MKESWSLETRLQRIRSFSLSVFIHAAAFLCLNVFTFDSVSSIDATCQSFEFLQITLHQMLFYKPYFNFPPPEAAYLAHPLCSWIFRCVEAQLIRARWIMVHSCLKPCNHTCALTIILKLGIFLPRPPIVTESRDLQVRQTVNDGSLSVLAL